MFNRRKLAMVLVAVALGLGMCIPAAQAASITWDSVFEVFTDGDIDLSGTVISAINGGPVGAADIDVNIGGTVITFVSPDPPLLPSTNLGAGGIPSIASTGNAELDEVFESHVWVSGAPPAEPTLFSLGGLTLGQGYQVQIIAAADGRDCCWERTQTFQDTADGLGNISDPVARSSDLTGSGERRANSVIGTFTADSAEQSVWIMGATDPGMSGYILSSMGGAPPTGVRMLTMTGQQENDNAAQVYTVNRANAGVNLIAELTNVPEGQRVAWNPRDGLVYHFAGAESWTDDVTRTTGYRDHQYLETYDMDSEEMTPIFNANPPPADPAPNDFPVWGLPAPHPEWALPNPRRTVDQTDNSFRTEIGVGRTEGEYHALRDLAWSQAEGLWYGADELGLFKVTPTGESTFVGRPEDDPDTGVNESSSLKAMTLVRDFTTGTEKMIVGMRKDMGLYDIDMETGQVSNRIEVTLVDDNGTQLPPQDDDGLVALAQDPVDGTIYGINRNPNDNVRRKLFTLDPETGIGTVIGELFLSTDDGDFSSITFSGWIVGDINGDGEVNGLDVDPFVDVVLNGSDERLTLLKADMNGDNEVNGLDVDPFVAAVVGAAGQANVPEPSTIVLAGLALLGLVWCGRRRR